MESLERLERFLSVQGLALDDRVSDRKAHRLVQPPQDEAEVLEVVIGHFWIGELQPDLGERPACIGESEVCHGPVASLRSWNSCSERKFVHVSLAAALNW